MMAPAEFSYDWDLVVAALTGKIKPHPSTLRKWRRDVERFRLEELNDYYFCEIDICI